MTKNRGFTLIELLVTIAIVAALMIVSIPAFGKSGDRQKLSQAAEEVGAAIRQTENLAMAPSGDKNKNTNAYAIESINDHQYRIREYIYTPADPVQGTSAHTSYNPAKPDAIKQFDLPANTTFTNNFISLFFYIPDGKMIKNAMNTETITLQNSKLTANNTKTIKVNFETGQVEIK